MTEEPRRICLHGDLWAIYGRPPNMDSGWVLIGTATTDDPDSAARQGCILNWASGTHPILVANTEEAREYRITIETEEA